MKASSTAGGGKAKKKKTSYAAEYKKMTGVAPRQKTKKESVSSVTAGVKTNRVSDKKKAATRSMVANAAMLAVPGGAVVRGVSTAIKGAKAVKNLKSATQVNKKALERMVSSGAIKTAPSKAKAAAGAKTRIINNQAATNRLNATQYAGKTWSDQQKIYNTIIKPQTSALAKENQQLRQMLQRWQGR